MKWLDHYLQHRREKLALKQVRPDDVILDFGCHNGHLFHDVELEFSSAIGIDNDSSQMLAWSQVSDDRVRFICGGVSVIESLPTQFKPTLIVSLAVMEHLDERSIAQFGWTTSRVVTEGGRLFITVPNPVVDGLIAVGKKLRLLDGMDIEAHHGLRPARVVEILEGHQWRLEHWRRFQFGLNNALLFVVDK